MPRLLQPPECQAGVLMVVWAMSENRCLRPVSVPLAWVEDRRSAVSFVAYSCRPSWNGLAVRMIPINDRVGPSFRSQLRVGRDETSCFRNLMVDYFAFGSHPSRSYLIRRNV